MMDILNSYLVQHKSINIPGLGTIYLETIPARNDFVNKKLLPPYYIYRFNKYVDAPDKEFFTYLALKKKIADYEAIRWYNDFAYKLRNQIRNHEEAEWAGVGTFKKDASGDIVFEDSRIDRKLFVPVDALRVIRSNASHHMLVGDRETTTTRMTALLQEEVHTEKAAWWIYALILAAAGLIAGFFYFFRYGINTASLFK